MSNAKQRYKELFESIKITRDQNNEKVTSLLNEIENLKTKVKGKIPVTSYDYVSSKVCACKKYTCDVVLIPLPLRNSKLVHSDYLRHLKDCLDMLREIVEENKLVKPHDDAMIDACFLTNRSQELLEFAIGTCPKMDNIQVRSSASSSKYMNKHVASVKSLRTSEPNTSPSGNQLATKQTNVPIIASTGVKSVTRASGSQPRCNTKNDRTSPAKSTPVKKVEDHLRNNKSDLNEMNRVDSSIFYKRTVINSNSAATHMNCNDCLISGNHDDCVVLYLKSLNRSPVTSVMKSVGKKHVWKATGKLFTNVGYQWKPTGRKFTLGEKCPMTRFTNSKVVPIKEWRPTGRMFPLEAQSTNSRSSASSSKNTNSISVTYDNPIFACANQTDLN